MATHIGNLVKLPYPVPLVPWVAAVPTTIEWYRQGLVSQGRAAEIAGVARADFIDGRTN
jgi:hypothetical protein